MAMRSYKTASGRSISESGADFGEKEFEAIGKALYSLGQDVLRESLPLVPVDTGALRASGYVTEPDRKGDLIIVEIGYGGVASQINPKTLELTGKYALYVHENLEAHHDVGQAKYLQIPFDDQTKGFGTKLSEAVKAARSGATVEPDDSSGGGGEPE